MNTNYILSAIASSALLLAGCSQDVPAEAPVVDKPIEFGTYIGRHAPGQSRAISVDFDHIKQPNVGFGVFAYYTVGSIASATNPTANFMNNQQVTFAGDDTNNIWTYTPIRYWPNGDGDLVSFFAYAPYNSTTEVSLANKNKPVINYVAYDTSEGADPMAKQTDLLYTAPVKDQAKPQVNTTIDFHFKHALSRIGFTVACAVDQSGAGGVLDANTKVTVERIILSDSKYTQKEGPDDEPEDPKGGLYLSGKLNLDVDNGNNPTNLWLETVTDDNVSFGFDPAAHFGNAVLQKTTDDQGIPTTSTLTTPDDKYLMIIPQKFQADGKAFYVSIRYKVTTTVPGSGTTPVKVSEITNYISKEVALDFEAGKAYTFNLVLGLTSVQMTATCDPWEDVTAQQIDLPVNKDTNTGGTTNP